MRRAALVSGAVAAGLFAGCACPGGVDHPFVLGRDSFAFRNELRWEYEFGENGEVATRKAESPPEYSLRCFPMVRAAREFFYHAEFRPGEARLGREEYRALVKEVIGRSSRCPAPAGERIAIPGFADLHAFSAEYGGLIQNLCGGAARSFLQRGNWRMVFPVSKGRFRKSAGELVNEIRGGKLPIVHVYQFPNTTLNHALLLYAAEETEEGVAFAAYDPNDPAKAARLLFDREESAFRLDRTRYFAGGKVRVYEVYRGAFY